jgi:DNA gyrase/topoisomerase IV subunit B
MTLKVCVYTYTHISIMSPKTKKTGLDEYSRPSQIDHCLEQPGMYIGNITFQQSKQWVEKTGVIKLKRGRYNMGLLHIFLELLSNAEDNIVRSRLAKVPITKIKVDIGDDGRITIWNDGKHIPVKMYHPKKNDELDGPIWLPQMIFSEFRAGSNFISKKEGVGGTYGIGAKGTNTFSKEFKVEIYDPEEQKLYTQTFTNNMKEVGKPKIKSKKKKNGYTKISYLADFKRFGCEGYSPDMLALLRKHIYDCAMIAKVKVELNGEPIVIKNFLEYVHLYEKKAKKIDFKSKDCEVVLVENNLERDFYQVSFVNTICTCDGGIHVDDWLEGILRPILNKFNGEKKKNGNGKGKKKTPPKKNTVTKLRLPDIKKYFVIFVRMTTKKPEFLGQQKSQLTGPRPTVNVPQSRIKKITKWDVAVRIENHIKFKAMQKLAKTDGKKRSFVNVEGAVDAKWAGTKRSNECTLILCEGKSAATFAVTGIAHEKAGCKYGILPLKGKVFNPRGAKVDTINKNKEITAMKKMLGLTTEMDYSDDDNLETLRYGYVKILTDSDLDGIHIQGLIINFFDCMFPSLLERDGFVSYMPTPIVKMMKRKKPVAYFYSLEDFRDYLEENEGLPVGVSAKYYKGLGTWAPAEVPEAWDQRRVEYIRDEDAAVEIDKAFNKKKADARKQWLAQYEYERTNYEEDEEMEMTDFINKELIKFSIYDCARSVPHVLDGLKISQRKILFACFRKNIVKEVKVAQLSGYVAEQTEYHHGEASLQGAIIKMAQDYVGSNNVPLLEGNGQFGCLDPSTPILMWDGTIKKAGQIKIGDKLVGDDGKVRNVLKLTNGKDQMYKVVSQRNGSQYIVNSNHILTLYCSAHKSIYWKKSDSSWVLTYFDENDLKFKQKMIRTNIKSSGHFNSSKVLKKEGYSKILETASTIPDNNIFDIHIKDYLRMNNTTKHHMKGIKNSNIINWKHKSIPIDPYIFGMWLGDGNHDGCGFASIDNELIKEWVIWADSIGAEITHCKNGNDHENCHFGLRRRGSAIKGGTQIIPIGNPKHSSETCIGCLTSHKKYNVCDWVMPNKQKDEIEIYGTATNGMRRNDLNPFKEILKKNDLYKNKYIPIEYIVNDEETRLRLLAGIIDTDGTVRHSNNVQYIEISQSDKTHGHIIDSIELIAKSLGFHTHISFNKKDEEHITKVILISGYGLELIPTILPRKKIYRRVEFLKSKNPMITGIKIEPVSQGKFVGWSVDGNERFLLGDGTITHNSRLSGGDDAAAARYIFVEFSPLTRLLFRPEDDILLNYLEDDGKSIEPEFYMPILPVILINGCDGIGTGHSTSIPCYNPKDLARWIQKWLEKRQGKKTNFSKLVPWYQYFTGTIEEISEKKYASTGIMKKNGSDVNITELPIGTWTDKYKTGTLTKLVEEKKIKKFEDEPSPIDINLTVNTSTGFKPENLKLQTTFTTTNLTAFDQENHPIKYDSPEDILEKFCSVRIEYYIKRKKTLLKQYKEDLKYLKNKIRFLKEVMDDKLIVAKRDEDELFIEMEENEYDKKDDSYRYLVDMPIRSFTQKRLDDLAKLIKDVKIKIKELKKTTVEDIWRKELIEFLEAYNKYITKKEKQRDLIRKGKIKVKKTKRKKK